MNQKKLIYFGIVLAVLLLVAELLWLLVPSPADWQRESVCRVEAEGCYELSLESGQVLYLPYRSDSAPYASLHPEGVSQKVSMSGFFVSNEGHVVTTDSLFIRSDSVLSGNVLKQRLRQVDSLLRVRIDYQRALMRELDYYANRHSVVDDGYNQVMAFRARVAAQLVEADSVSMLLRRSLSYSRLQAHLQTHVRVIVPADTASYEARIEKCRNGLVLVGLKQNMLPQKASRFSVYRWGIHTMQARLLAFNDWGEKSASIGVSTLQTNDVLLPATEGGSWVNWSGNLCGIQRASQRVPASQISELLAEKHCWPVWWWKNLRAWGRSLCTSHKEPVLLLPKEYAHAQVSVRICYPDTSVYEGQYVWVKSRNSKQRQGYGRLMCADGTRYEGYWHCDTLQHGICRDSCGIYQGNFNRNGLPNGHGVMLTVDGEYYDGEWLAGKRHGHGFSVCPGRVLHCGMWQNNRFKGERMVYTPDRVYGIDISRHQHEKKNRRYGINWDKVRITSLGPGRRVQGMVDYPVSFVYIKSTEGRNIFNRYYLSDMRQARRRGIAVGTYHFFSTRTSGAVQAAHFLRKSVVAKGDLPPVLDVEPSEWQIKQMGGDSVLFREMRVWLQRVEKACGKRPILYISQMFVNQHMRHAPADLLKYDVWIARYGEFKPYVRLLHWQLTPYGRVRGITGEVDINVFNGTHEQFDAYLQQLRE